MSILQLITWICVGGIFIAFLWMCINAFRLHKCGTIFKNANKNANPLEALTAEKLIGEKTRFLKECDIDYHGNKKSNIPSEEFFNELNICNAYGINLRLIDAGSGTLVGLGLFGTFLGLTLGIDGFDSSNSQNIQASIQSLLDGMGTAFWTSLVGMITSIIYTYFEKGIRNKLHKNLSYFNKKTDEQYYISDYSLSHYTQEVISNSLFEKIQNLLQYSNTEGHKTPISNAVREILVNNQEQTKALKSFSSDLALELNQGFDEVLSRQMQEKILPLMENVDATTRVVIEHIDRISADLQSPATEMIEHVIKELKSSIVAMTEEFKTSLSDNATHELEKLAITLSKATESIGEFPKNLANISDVLQLTITEVRNSISEISNSSAAANSSAIKQMQEQIVFATSSISDAINEVKEVMTSITQSSRNTSTELIETMAKSAENMSSFVQSTVDKMSGSLQNSIQSISDDIAYKQTTLLSLQEDTTLRTEKLLDSFNNSLTQLNATNATINNTLSLFKHIQSDINGATGHMQTITMDMKSATESFHKRQLEYAQEIDKLQKETGSKIDEILNLFQSAGTTTDEYAGKFEIIRQGLTQIFSQIQEGLKDYSTTVRTSIQLYLDAYSKNLTETTSNLASAINSTGELAEMLVDSVNNSKKQ